jgi:D-alanyl-D-alanine carboxypeptidase
MRRPLLIPAIALFVFVSSAAHAQDLLLNRFGDYLESLRIQSGIPGLAAAIVGNNEIIWEQAFGRQDIERSLPTRIDTPFHLDGLTQVFTATRVLRCVEDGTLSLDDSVGKFKPGDADAGATIRELLSHTSGDPSNPVFAYRPERLDPLVVVTTVCAQHSFRETVANLLQQFAMVESVPGPDVINLEPQADGFPTPAAVEQYTALLQRLATPYAIDQKGRATPTQYTATTLTPSAGLISTVRDFAEFMFALRKGYLRPETLALAWRPPVTAGGKQLPHGLGWFVQSYHGETVVWQFGVGENGSSSLAITVPARGLTLILLANSNRLVKPFALSAGDLTVSPFGRVFLSLFVR